MKIAHVVVAGEIGGAERMLATLARSPETGAEHEVFLFTPSRALFEVFRDAELLVHDRGTVHENPIAFMWRQLGPLDAAWLTHEIGHAKVDAVHVHTLGSQVLGTRAARALGLPVVRTEHSTRVLDDPTAWPFARWSLARAAASVAVSAHVAERVKKKAPWAAKKVSVIPNGVDTDRFALAPPLAADRPLTLLFLGRLEPRKGADLALRALARVPDVRLLLCGDGEDRSEIARLVSDLGLDARVELRGHVSDPVSVIPEAHAILASSRAEGLGIAFLEAMSMGRPVVGLVTGGIREITDPDTSLVGAPSREVDSARVDQLAAHIRDAKANLATLSELGGRARAKVLASYSRASMAAGYAEIYRAVTRR